MRKIWLVILLALATGLLSPRLAMAETLTIVADKWCPYNCGQDDAKPGYMIEIVKAALKKSGVDVAYKVVPWTEAIEKTRTGEYDAVVGASRGDAPDFIFPEVLQGISINEVWVKKDSNWVYDGLPSLDKKRIGIIAGYSYGRRIDPYLKKRMADDSSSIKVIHANNATEQNIEALLSGEVDLILEDKNVIEYYFASHNTPIPIKAVGNPVNIKDVEDTFIYVAFGPNNPKAKEYAALLTSGVQQMRKNGELASILASYNISESYIFNNKH